MADSVIRRDNGLYDSTLSVMMRGRKAGVLTIVMVRLQDHVTKVHAELSAPDADPPDVVGAELRRQSQDDILVLGGLEAGNTGVSVVIELVLEWVRQHSAGPGAWSTLSSNPEESIGTSTIITEVLNEEFVLLGSEVDSATDTMQCGPELSQQSLDTSEVGRDAGGAGLRGVRTRIVWTRR